MIKVEMNKLYGLYLLKEESYEFVAASHDIRKLQSVSNCSAWTSPDKSADIDIKSIAAETAIQTHVIREIAYIC